jgi:hypothetical protein
MILGQNVEFLLASINFEAAILTMKTLPPVALKYRTSSLLGHVKVFRGFSCIQ